MIDLKLCILNKYSKLNLVNSEIDELWIWDFFFNKGKNIRS